MEQAGLNQGQFAEQIGVAPATLSNILKGKTKPSLELVQNIRIVFPQYSYEWIMDGTGEMTVSAGSSIPADTEPGFLFQDDEPEAGTATPFSTPKVESQMGSAAVSGNRNVENPTNSKESVQVKIIEKSPRKVKEIMVLYEDGAYEVFVPKK